MSTNPLVMYTVIRQQPGAGPRLPQRSPGRRRRKRFALRLRHRTPVSEKPAVPAVLTPADLRS